MKKFSRKVLAAAVFALVCLLGMSVSAFAKVPKYGVPKGGATEVIVWGEYGATYSGIKNSNKKVASVKVACPKDINEKMLMLYPKKAGTTTVTFKATVDGKTTRYKIKFVVYNYKNPFKTLTIGNTSLKNYFKNTFYPTVSAGISGKLNFTLTKGWKVADIQHVTPSGNVKIKKNDEVSLGQYDILSIGLKNKKLGITQYFHLYAF